jgi:hypothetical protein
MNHYDPFETELDRINKYYRYKIVTIIPSMSSIQYTPENIPEFCTGMFLEAMESGIWLMSIKTCKKDFFYHGQIIKIEENELIDPKSMTKDQREIVEKQFKEYEERRKQENKEYEERIQTRYDKDSSGNDIPDVMNPNDIEGTMDMIQKVQKMVEDNRKENYLDKRKKPEEKTES